MDEAYLLFHGGAIDDEHSELGGVQLEINLPWLAHILAENGQRLDHYGRFFNFPNSPKKPFALDIAERLEFFPNIPGIERHDWNLHRGKKTPKELPIDGQIITHAHIDHIGNIIATRYDLPTYTHPYSVKLMHVWQYTSGRTVNQLVDLIEQFSLVPNTLGRDKFVDGDEAVFRRDIRTFESGIPFYVNKLKITPWLVDHSLAGSCGFILETPYGNIGISGDIRKRGRRPEDTERFVQELLKADVRYLLWEGSLLHFPHYGTEDDVKEKVKDLCNGRNFVSIAFPPRDLDRLTSLYEAAKASKRILVLTSTHALLLKAFNGVNGYPKINNKYIGFLLPPKNKGIIGRDGFSEELIEADYFYRERFLLDAGEWDGGAKSKLQRISLEDIANNQDQFLVYMPKQYLQLLGIINPKENSLYIRSHPAPWTKGMEIDELETINHLEANGMHYGPQPDAFYPGKIHKLLQVHVTGHYNIEEFTETINRFNCTLIPYHTTDPRISKRIYKGETIIPHRGKKIMLQ